MNFLLFNGSFREAGTPLLTAGNRGFRYGDGLFETIRVEERQICNESGHWARLTQGSRLMELPLPLPLPQLGELIRELCRKNGCADAARVRLALYRQEEGTAGWLAEAAPLDPSYKKWNEKGWEIGIYPHARKAQDAFANLKTANFLPYVLADRFARAQGLDDCLVLNSEGKIADSSRANIFLVRGDEVFTPALHQGPVKGVMRQLMIDGLKAQGLAVRQEALEVSDLMEANEVFLTNALMGIRWVARFREKEYGSSLSSELYRRFLKSPMGRSTSRRDGAV